MENNSTSRDIIILATKKNMDILRLMIPYCKKNIDCRDIYIIANNDLKSEINTIEGVIFFDEAEVIQGLDFNAVGDIIETITGTRYREGWYLQQFIKLGWSYVCKDKDYIVIDADTMPLNKIEFLDRDGNYLFTKKIEFNKPYFDTINKLFNGQIERKVDYSFIAENMIFNCEYVKEMLSKIMNNADIPGNTFYEKILHAIDPKELLYNGFSEFETYGNYMYNLHPDCIKVRSLRTQREAVFLLGSKPTQEQLEWATNDYDIISIELNDYKRTLTTTLTSLAFFRTLIPMRCFAKIRSRIRTIYRKLTNRADYKFENN